MRKIVFALVFALGFWSSAAYAFDTALYSHCTKWTERAVGEALAGVAIQQGYPASAPLGERSGDRAYRLVSEYFTAFLASDPPEVAHVYCGIFMQQGPDIFPEW